MSCHPAAYSWAVVTVFVEIRPSLSVSSSKPVMPVFVSPITMAGPSLPIAGDIQRSPRRIPSRPSTCMLYGTCSDKLHVNSECEVSTLSGQPVQARHVGASGGESVSMAVTLKRLARNTAFQAGCSSTSTAGQLMLGYPAVGEDALAIDWLGAVPRNSASATTSGFHSSICSTMAPARLPPPCMIFQKSIRISWFHLSGCLCCGGPTLSGIGQT